jgi:hypothetical protein
MKLTVKDVRSVISEVVAERRILEEKVRKHAVLENRAARIRKIITEKDGWMNKLSNAFNVNPSQDVDDPSKVKKVLDRSIAVASKIAGGFEASALNTTKAINQFHTSVRDSLDKVTSLADTLGPAEAAEYQKKIVELVRTFYGLLKREADRIESFQQTIKSDLADKGMDKRVAYQNTTGLAKKPAAVKAPKAGSVMVPPRQRPSGTIATNVANPSRASNASFRTG